MSRSRWILIPAIAAFMVWTSPVNQFFVSEANAQSRDAYCRAYARDVSRRYSRGGAVGGAVRGGAGGAVVGGIVNGKKGARKGARIGAASGAVARKALLSAEVRREIEDLRRERLDQELDDVPDRDDEGGPAAFVGHREMTKALGKILHRPTILPPVPAFLIKGVLGEFSDVFVKGQKVLPRKLLQDGFVFEYPEIEAAFAHLIH